MTSQNPISLLLLFLTKTVLPSANGSLYLHFHRNSALIFQPRSFQFLVVGHPLLTILSFLFLVGPVLLTYVMTFTTTLAHCSFCGHTIFLLIIVRTSNFTILLANLLYLSQHVPEHLFTDDIPSNTQHCNFRHIELPVITYQLYISTNHLVTVLFTNSPSLLLAPSLMKLIRYTLSYKTATQHSASRSLISPNH